MLWTIHSKKVSLLLLLSQLLFSLLDLGLFGSCILALMLALFSQMLWKKTGWVACCCCHFLLQMQLAKIIVEGWSFFATLDFWRTVEKKYDRCRLEVYGFTLQCKSWLMGIKVIVFGRATYHKKKLSFRGPFFHFYRVKKRFYFFFENTIASALKSYIISFLQKKFVFNFLNPKKWKNQVF